MLIKNSYKNTDQINILLEYIEHFTDPNKLFSQYGKDVQLGEIRSNLLKAYNKLDLYLTLVRSGVKVCSSHSVSIFEEKVYNNSQGSCSDQNLMLCNICNLNLIEYDKFQRLLTTKLSQSRKSKWL